jgi:hypothetical protein
MHSKQYYYSYLIYENIGSVNITKEYIIHTIKYRAYRNEAKLLKDDDFGERCMNNIEAYDWDDHLIRTIGDTVGDIRKSFYCCKVVANNMLSSKMLIKSLNLLCLMTCIFATLNGYLLSISKQGSS